MTEVALKVLNRALAADRGAITEIFSHRCACKPALADDPTIPVHGDEFPTVGAMGLFNGILGEMGLPLVAGEWTGDGRLVGFREYRPCGS